MTRKTLLGTTAALATGLALGYFLFNTGGQSTTTLAKKGEKEIAYWVAPMDPNYRREGPGKSPMGMDLIPVYVGEEPGKGDVGFQIAPNILHNLGVKTATVTMTDFAPTIKTSGKIAYNESTISHIQVRAEGWVEKLVKRTVGDKVEKGDHLFSFYAPEIANAISDYHQAAPLSRQLKKAAYQRIQSYGLTDRSIRQVLKSKNPHAPIPVYADRSGIISRLGIRDGGRIGKNTVAYEITDISNLWVIADVYISDAAPLAAGQQAVINDKDYAAIDYIYPNADQMLQTVQVRMVMDNPDNRYKAGQYTSVKIKVASKQQLTVPDTAIIRLGDMNRVILDHGDGRFEAAEVKTGPSSEGMTVIIEGLTEGENIVISGQFMLDSESSFSGAAVRMAEQADKKVESLAFAMGTINSVNIEENKVNITHPEIPDIDWPPMTMNILVANGIDLTKIQDGTKVHFGVGKNADGIYVITVIHTMDQMNDHEGMM